MTNTELNTKLLSLVRAERALTHEILELLNTVEARSLHLEMGYASLFDYLTKFLGYCESSAYRRMQAARLLREVPQVKEKIVEGKIQLSQMAKLQSAVRAQERPVSQAVKREVLSALEGKSLEETKKILARELPGAENPRKPISYGKEHLSLTLRLSSEQFAKFQKVKELLSHAVPGGSFEEILEKLCEEKIAQKTEVKNEPKITARKGRATINTNLRKAIFAKYHYECQYRDESTGHQCRSKHFLELEHTEPLAYGGTNDPGNLTVLCRAHNRLKAREAGLL